MYHYHAGSDATYWALTHQNLRDLRVFEVTGLSLIVRSVRLLQVLSSQLINLQGYTTPNPA